MGESTYQKKLNCYEYDRFVKKVKCFMTLHDLDIQDIAVATGYAKSTVYSALTSYDRCSRFFAAMVEDYMGRVENEIKK